MLTMLLSTLKAGNMSSDFLQEALITIFNREKMSSPQLYGETKETFCVLWSWCASERRLFVSDMLPAGISTCDNSICFRLRAAYNIWNRDNRMIHQYLAARNVSVNDGCVAKII